MGLRRKKTYLTFQTADAGNEIDTTGVALLRRLGDALESLGFPVDYEAGRDESDWLFAVWLEDRSFLVILSLLGLEPCRCFSWPEGGRDGCGVLERLKQE